MARHYRWRDATGDGVQEVMLDRAPGQVSAEGLVIAPGFAARFRLLMDQRWRTRRLSVAVLGRPGVLVLLADGQGGWTDGDGAALPALDGVVDVELGMTPLTASLPIRRLRTAVGKSVTLDIAHVALPDLTVTRDARGYTRLEDRLWRCESRDIAVDEDGVVIDDPGRFTRVTAP